MTQATLLEKATRCMAPNYAPPPFVIDHGAGALVWDVDGNEYVDVTGGIGVNALGHAHPRVVDAIRRQAGRICHTSNMLYHAPHIEMCARLCALSFGERVYLSNSGTESTEAALKLARRTFFDRGELQRTEIVATHASFHGRTMGAISMTGQPEYQKGFAPLLPGIKHVPFGDLDAMRGVVGDATAAVIVEPIQGNSGVTVPPVGYMAGLRALCNERGCLLIFDEVQTGIARTGKWFAYEHEGMRPDIMALAKAVGGGLPLGAVVTTEAIARAFQPGVHASTFGGNPVACAAGLATLDVIEEERLVERAASLGDAYRRQIASLPAARVDGAVIETRGRGLLIGVVTRAPAKEIAAACQRHGLLVTTAGPNVLRLFPPLNVEPALLDRSLEALDRALRAVRALSK